MDVLATGTRSIRHRVGRKITIGLVGSLAALGMLVGSVAASSPSIKFEMGRSGAVVGANCLPKAKAKVKVKSVGPVEIMTVDASGLPPKTEFDLFVIQIPNPTFGISWYQGDLETDKDGEAHQQYIGRFNVETFAVAPGSVPAPHVHDLDASVNPQFAPVHTYHLGLWFNSPQDALAAGCPGNTTPFNGDHNAGVQVLNTGTFPDDSGPLRQLKP